MAAQQEKLATQVQLVLKETRGVQLVILVTQVPKVLLAM
jgi:hypothetical protein